MSSDNVSELIFGGAVTAGFWFATAWKMRKSEKGDRWRYFMHGEGRQIPAVWLFTFGALGLMVGLTTFMRG